MHTASVHMYEIHSTKLLESLEFVKTDIAMSAIRGIPTHRKVTNIYLKNPFCFNSKYNLSIFCLCGRAKILFTLYTV